MKSTITIPQITPSETTDFEELFKIGIALIQKYSGDIWTDYNAHDPGVTILELLCYVQTELFDKAELPIKDILTQANGAIPLHDNSFFSAAEILHNSALTLNDYRKIIIDQLPDVSNAWVSPYYSYNDLVDQPIGISGMYKVMIDLREDVEPNTDNLLCIQQEAYQLLNAQSLISEYFPFNCISFLKPLPLVISFTIRVDSDMISEVLLAEIIFNLEVFMKPIVKHYTYQYLESEGFNSDQIFDGPKLMNGFIKDSDLLPMRSILYINDLNHIICKIIGVRSIEKLCLVINNSEVFDKFIIPNNCSINLDIYNSLKNIEIKKDHSIYNYSLNATMSNYNELKASNLNTLKFKLPESVLDIPIPPGNFTPISDYYSLQNDFPMIYSIGTNRLSSKVPETRKANALQLKSYLLFFEQILADAMQQVACLPQLFSKQSQDQTYFFQTLYNVPDIAPLLNGFSGAASDIYNTTNAQLYQNAAKQFINDPNNNYITQLRENYKTIDDFSVRRQQFLDHVLARFSYELPAVPNYYESKEESISAEQLISIKEKMLGLLPDLTYSRGKHLLLNPQSYDSTFWNYDRTGFMHLISGLPYGHPSTKTFDQFRILQPVDLHNGSTIFNQTEGSRIQINIGHTETNDAIVAGLVETNYELGFVNEKLTINLKTKSDQLLIYTFKGDSSHNLALKLISDIMYDCLKLYLEIETIYSIDHIRLLPDLEAQRFSWKDDSDPSKIPSEALSYAAILEAIDTAFIQFQSKDSASAILPSPCIEIIEGTQRIHQNFYSNKISIIVPAPLTEAAKDRYTNYFQSVLQDIMPAHLHLEFFWLDQALFQQFIKTYTSYVLNEANSKFNLIQLLLSFDVYKIFVRPIS